MYLPIHYNLCQSTTTLTLLTNYKPMVKIHCLHLHYIDQANATDLYYYVYTSTLLD